MKFTYPYESAAGQTLDYPLRELIQVSGGPSSRPARADAAPMTVQQELAARGCEP